MEKTDTKTIIQFLRIIRGYLADVDQKQDRILEILEGKKRKKQDLVGERFGKLVVVAEGAPHPRKGYSPRRTWNCKCDCGEDALGVLHSNLKAGTSTSCGCTRYKNDIIFQHSKSRTPTYKSWDNMIQRCTNPNRDGYENYGGRGINICPEWMESFKNFLEDMGEKPEGLTLERIDVDGDYTPGNCKWATWKEQAQNKRNSY